MSPLEPVSNDVSCRRSYIIILSLMFTIHTPIDRHYAWTTLNLVVNVRFTKQFKTPEINSENIWLRTVTDSIAVNAF